MQFIFLSLMSMTAFSWIIDSSTRLGIWQSKGLVKNSRGTETNKTCIRSQADTHSDWTELNYWKLCF